MAVRPWKEEINGAGVAGATFFNTLFLVLALVDYSADLWAFQEPASRLSFLASFYKYRAEPPIFQWLLMALSVLIPFVIFGMIKDAVMSIFGLRRAPLLRHVADITQALTLPCILYASIAVAAPAAEAMIAECATGKKLTVACTSTAEALPPLHLFLTIANAVMFACDITKYAVGIPSSDKAKKQ